MTSPSEHGRPEAVPATPSESLQRLLADAEVIDLGQPMRVGMPQSPNHVPYRMMLDRRHGDVVQGDGGSMANEVVVTSGHIGTHVDALGHMSTEGRVFGEHATSEIQSQSGLSRTGIDEFVPFVGRAVLLDVAALHGVTVLEAGYEVTARDLELAVERAQVELRAGDAVLIGTGWSRHWGDPVRFVGVEDGVPGPGEEAAAWLAVHGPRLVGAETVAFEHIRPKIGHSALPAHRIFLVENGVNIIEMMRLLPLMERQVTEFTLIVNPLLLVGATGAPVRPLGLLSPEAAADGVGSDV